MLLACHALIYSDDAPATRAFFRDVLGFPFVDAGPSEAVDVDAGWLIFRTGASELGVHPTGGGRQHHQISLMCDDIEATVAELRAKGVEFTRDIRDDGFGLTIDFLVPGAGDMQLYQPRHPSAFDLP